MQNIKKHSTESVEFVSHSLNYITEETRPFLN